MEEEIIKETTKSLMNMENEYAVFYGYFSQYQKILNKMAWKFKRTRNSSSRIRFDEVSSGGKFH